MLARGKMPTKRLAPYVAVLPKMTPQRREAFARMVASGPEEMCWPWTGMKDRYGYGAFKAGQYCKLISSRVAYAIANQAEPGTAHVLHSCDNPICCNPAHLSLGDPRINAQDKVRRGRARGRFSVRGSNEPSAHVQRGAPREG